MDKAKKKRIKQSISWVLLAALVAGLAVMPLLAQAEEEADGPVASILEGSVQMGSVESALHGGGTLKADSAMDITLPTGVKITEFLVKNGDTVTKGTPVAAVDTVSVMNAIVQVQDSMDYLQDQITDARDDTVSNTITATAGGLVKRVYGREGDSVQDVMLAHGALAVLSLDGRMAVDIRRNMALAAGDSVCVTFSDDTEITGRVESNLNGTIVITVEDDDYAVGEKVTVTTEDGDRIGSGELYIHNAWKATAFSGTIKSVSVKENSEVSDGATLFRLTDTDFTGNLERLSSLHREYEALLQELFQMYETEVITAPCDGMISGVDEDSAHLLSTQEDEQDFADLLSGTAQPTGWTVMLLGDIAYECNGTAREPDACPAEEHIEGCYYYCTGTSDCTAKKHNADCYYHCTGQISCTAKDHDLTCLKLCISSDGTKDCPNPENHHRSDCIESCICSDGTEKCPATGAHKTGCIESCISADGTKDCPATGTHKDDCIEKCDQTGECPAKKHHYSTCLTFCTGTDTCPALCHKDTCYMANLVYYGYASHIQQVGTQELIVRKDAGTRYQMTTGGSGWKLISPAQLQTSTLVTPGKVSVADASLFAPGDVILEWVGYKDGTAVKSGVAVYTSIPLQTPGENQPDTEGAKPGMDAMTGAMGGMSSAMSGISGLTGSFGSFGSFGSTVTEVYELFDLNGDVLMTVTDRSAMTLTITLDEQDIAKVSAGQTAEVKVTALKGQTFEAEITEIGTIGTNSGGSSKFTVELTLPMDENMLSGMNATATIPLFTKMEVLTIPVAALTDTPEGTFVFTALDPETGDPANPVAVTTGISDGENVEILSGLANGDKFYYSYYDTFELDHTAKAENNFSFG